jgi:hypothetical protein
MGLEEVLLLLAGEAMLLFPAASGGATNEAQWCMVGASGGRRRCYIRAAAMA